MAEPLSPSATAELLKRHGVRLDRRHGQNFLIDPNIVRRIVEIAGCGPGDLVVEIGAGAGTLTRALAASGATVVAYEIDEGLRSLLDDTLDGVDGVEVRFADATTVDLDGDLPGGPWTMVANLPYNVGTPILLDALRHAPRITRFVVMLQREAVDRLVAQPGSKTYGLPSVVAGLHGRAETVLRVPGHVFMPPTPVTSSVAVIDRIEPHPSTERAIDLAASVFGQRRKMLRSSLKGVVPDPEAALATAGISPTARPEQLAPVDYLALAEAT